MGRRELRENIFKILFLSVFNENEEMPQQLQLFFDGISDLKESDRDYIEKKYGAVQERLAAIDVILNQCATGWKTSRMSKVDLAILRLAVFEIKFDEDVPELVAINEAVELGKRFGGEESSVFINGILGAVV